MGKKKGKKKKKYTKKQFVNIICTHCNMCGPIAFNPTFCYEEMYKNDSDTFMEYSYIHLLNLKAKAESKGFAFSIVTESEFREIFCYSMSDACGRKPGVYCKNILECLGRFKDQMFGIGSAKTKKNKKAEKFVCAAYSTFFTSDNEEWKNEIKGILEDGD